MHKKNRRRYDRSFKLEAVKRSYESGKAVTQVARELEISAQQLYAWRAECDKKNEEAFPGKGHTTPNTEIEVLRKENKRLREERDILKKSLIFFARESENDSGLSEKTKGSTQ